MAQIIEFYVPEKFKQEARVTSAQQRGKLILFQSRPSSDQSLTRATSAMEECSAVLL